MAAWTQSGGDGEEGGMQVRCTEQPGLADGQGTGAGQGRHASRRPRFFLELGWEPLEEKQDDWGGKGTESPTAVPSSR